MDNDLNYSADALSAKAIFYNKDFSIYVEGPDDLIFWKNICDYAKIKNYHIEDVGGDPIKTYINLLQDEDAEFIVASDLNYNDFLKKKVKNNKVVFTYGHSIENSMYYILERINFLIGSLTKSLKQFVQEITLAIEEMLESLENLIIYDVANFIFNKSISVLSNNCHKFLNSNKSFKLQKHKIQEVLEVCSQLITKEEFEYCKIKIMKSKKSLWFYVRGHFLASWILKLVKTLSEKHSGHAINISNDMMYSLFIKCDKNQKDIVYTRNKLKMAVKDFY